jgi:hypothetical protein
VASPLSRDRSDFAHEEPWPLGSKTAGPVAARSRPPAGGAGRAQREPGRAAAGPAHSHQTVLVPCAPSAAAIVSASEASSARKVRIDVDIAWLLGIRTLRSKNARCANVLISPRFSSVRSAARCGFYPALTRSAIGSTPNLRCSSPNHDQTKLKPSAPAARFATASVLFGHRVLGSWQARRVSLGGPKLGRESGSYCARSMQIVRRKTTGGGTTTCTRKARFADRRPYSRCAAVRRISARRCTSLRISAPQLPGRVAVANRSCTCRVQNFANAAMRCPPVSSHRHVAYPSRMTHTAMRIVKKRQFAKESAARCITNPTRIIFQSRTQYQSGPY